MKRIHFTVFNPLKEYGGLEIATTKLGAELQSRSFEVDIVTYPDSKVENLAKTLNLPIEKMKIENHYLNLMASFSLSRIFNKKRTDICIVGKSSLLSTAILAKKISRTKPVILFHQQMQSGLNKKDALHNWIYKNLDGAVVLNNKMKKDFLSTTIIEPSKISVIPYGIDTDKFKPTPEKKIVLRKKFQFPENDFLIGCVGRLDPQKGQDTLLIAVAELKNLENIKLIFAGSTNDEAYLNELQKIIEINSLNERVIFIPFTENIPELMNTFDILVIPSHCETFGLVIIEAMACSIPVISTDCGGVPEIIENGKNGFLFSPKNHEELSDLINMIYCNKQIFEKIGKLARETVLNKYQSDFQINSFIKFCLVLLANQSK